MIVTWAAESGPVKLWDRTTDLTPPAELRTLVADPLVTFVAHNSPFDAAVFAQCLGWDLPAERWQCTRAQAYAHGLPGGLEGLGAALGLSTAEAKAQGGQKLIQLFCVPKKDGSYVESWEAPSEWATFTDYACRDVDALRTVFKRLPSTNFTGANLLYFRLDAAINRRGFLVDLSLIEAAVDLLDRAKGRGDQDVADRTGGAVTAITQRDKLLRYLQERTGLALPNLRKAELENALQRDDLSPEQRLLIEARLEGARASGAKYKRATRMHVGGRLRYTMQVSGAGRTGRTAHKGFQPGNMPRAVTYNPLAKSLAEQHVPVKAKFIDEIILPTILSRVIPDPLIAGGPNTLAANALRHTIIAAPGNELICADYKNIESRVLAWLAGEDWKCLAYAAKDRGEGEDLYELLYSRFFGVDIEKVSDHERQAGKVVELACGFGGSVGAFVTMAVGYGIDLSTLPALVLPNASDKALKKAETVWWRAFLERGDYDLEPKVYQAIHVLVQMYRAANPKIDGLKKALGRAVETAVRIRGSFHEVGRCKIWANADVLIVELPSGYRLCYWQPEIETEKVLDPETGEEEERSFLSFKRARGARMIRERSWPGLTLENVVQSVANQILRNGSLEVEAVYPGIQILSVHDEILSEARKGAISLEHYIELMCKGWHWTRGLPLAADGWVGPRYGKRG